MQNRNVGECVMHVLLKGPSYDAKEECRSTPISFQDCLNVMAHTSAVYSPIGVKFSGFVLLINTSNLVPKTDAFQDINKFYVFT